MPKVNHERKDSDMGVIEILRKVTVTVKTFPFFYVAGLLFYWLIAPALSMEAITEIDGAIYLSLAMVLFLIRLSYCVKLCKWHRLQCSLPLLPQIVDKIDVYIYEFGTYLAIINYVIIGAIGVLSLINAYFVFIRPSVQNKRSLRSTA